MTTRTIPTLIDVRDILSMLTGIDVDVSMLNKSWEPSSEIYYVGSYCTKENNTLVLICVELPLAASLGALLTRFMPGRAKEAIDAKELDEDLLPNLCEIMNIFGSKLNVINVAHVVFKEAFANNALPEYIKTCLNQKPSGRADYVVDLDNYYSGKLSFLVFD